MPLLCKACVASEWVTGQKPFARSIHDTRGRSGYTYTISGVQAIDIVSDVSTTATVAGSSFGHLAWTPSLGRVGNGLFRVYSCR